VDNVGDVGDEGNLDHPDDFARVIDRLADAALTSVTSLSGPSPAMITLLLRRYVATGREDLRDAVGAALARAMHDASCTADRDERSEWLALLLEAVAFSEDARLRATSDAIAQALTRGWPGAGAVRSGMRSVEVVLAASAAMQDPADGLAWIAAAIDEMERIVGLAYTPGSGIAGEVASGFGRTPGSLGDHAGAASTLLTAFAMTGRLPYGMLADELMQFARRQWWDDGGGTFIGSSVSAQCDAARVYVRLEMLHRDEDYRQAAILAEAHYAADAERTLSALLPASETLGEAAGVYGLALLELFALRDLK
jgi:hypothetical protein